MSITPQQLLESALTRHRGVLSCDIVFGDDAGASVGHDDREAPFVPDDGDGEEPGFLISITDEDPERLCAVVRVAEDSDVLGVGIDLASTEDWTQDERGERFAELLFTEHEKALISAADGSVPLLRGSSTSRRATSSSSRGASPVAQAAGIAPPSPARSWASPASRSRSPSTRTWRSAWRSPADVRPSARLGMHVRTRMRPLLSQDAYRNRPASLPTPRTATAR